MKKSFAIIYNLLVCLLVCALVSSMGVPPIVSLEISALLFVAGFIPRNRLVGVLRDEVLITIFESDIQKNIFPDNAFYKNSKVDAGVAINATSVQVPQSGTLPTTIKNPTDFPLPVGQRTDDKKNYDVDLFATLPIFVQDVNQATVSYDKRADILQDHVDSLATRIADEYAYLWAATVAANIHRTTGTGNTGSKLTGMTGTRKELTYQDIIDMCTLFDNMNVPAEGRKVLFTANQIAELKKIAEFRDYDKTGIVGQLAAGALGKIQNFDVFMRSNTVVCDSSAAKKSVGSAVAATDNQAAIFWHPSFVRRAEGVVKVYMEIEKPQYLGSVFNAAVRAGGMIGRNDQKGVALLVQTA